MTFVSTLVSSRTLFGILALLGVSLLTGSLSQRVSPDPLPPVHRRGPSLRTELEAAGFPMLTPGEVRTLYQAGTHLFLDARSLPEYHQSHIPGAFPVPIADFDAHFPEIAPILESDSPLIVYCGNPACDQALRLAQRLQDAGYENVSIFPAGFEAWSAADTPEAGQ
ncbi:MAG: rhodanese-like domain-containing protein [Verrucomicrobia bacterium]|nr:rhodanese-like domain-containing protein [Verrucomicrobiota bacterium]MCH8525798.1 rhodanese-like domain-containing protein [Kiritimatiellia bacterium]